MISSDEWLRQGYSHLLDLEKAWNSKPRKYLVTDATATINAILRYKEEMPNAKEIIKLEIFKEVRPDYQSRFKKLNHIE